MPDARKFARLGATLYLVNFGGAIVCFVFALFCPWLFETTAAIIAAALIAILLAVALYTTGRFAKQLMAHEACPQVIVHKRTFCLSSSLTAAYWRRRRQD